MRRLRSKWWWIGSACVLVVAAGVGGWLVFKPASSTDAASAATTVTVASETVKQSVSASGTVSPWKSADLDFSVSGTVSHVYVAAGDTVAKGQKLAAVNSTSLVAARTAAAAQLSAAKTQLTTDIAADASAVQIASDRASIVSAQDNYDSAAQAVSDATLTATIGGTVTAVDIVQGDTVGSSSGSSGSTSGGAGAGGSSAGTTQSSSQSSSSVSAFSIVSDGTWLIDATVASSDVDSIKKGLQAEITVTGITDTIYGTVSSVGMVAQTSSSGAAVFPVTIKVTGERDDLFSGTTATASIIVKQTNDVITVASRALRTSGEEIYVMTVVDGKEVKQVVTIGGTYGASTVVTQGLAVGDKVVVPGFTRGSGSGSTGRSGSGSQVPDMSNMPAGGFQGGPPSGGFPGGGQ